jgi:hypothetical protein
MDGRQRSGEGGRIIPTVLALVVSWLLAAAAAGCHNPQRPANLDGLLPTSQAAVQAVADALGSRDLPRLETLAVTESEFRETIWPNLPSSAPDTGMPADYVWSDTNLRSRGALAERLGEYGGTNLTVEAVRFVGPTSDHGAFKVHRMTHVTVRDTQGRTSEIRIVGSMIESANGWKVYSYIVD